MSKEPVLGNGETILVVDDDASVLEVCCGILEALGYRVVRASDGIEALHVFESNINNIDLVILDVVMPKLGGMEAGYLMRQLNPEVKMLFVTGYDKYQLLAEHSTALNATVLSKPYKIHDLSHEVSKAIRGR